MTIRGRVGHINFTSKHGAITIEFATSDPEAVMVWVPPEVYSKLVRDAGQDAIDYVTGRTICVRGRIERYGGVRPQLKDRLQLKVEDANQFWLLANETPSPATAP